MDPMNLQYVEVKLQEHVDLFVAIVKYESRLLVVVPIQFHVGIFSEARL